MRIIGIIALAAGAIGCDGGSDTDPDTDNPGTSPPPIELGVADALAGVLAEDATTSSCSDTYVARISADDRFALTILLVGEPAAAAWTQGAPISETLTLPDAAVNLTLRWGAHLDEGFDCDDVLEETPVELGTATPTSGTLTYTLTPSDVEGAYSPMAFLDLALDDVVFDDGSGETAELATLTYTELFVGWFPG